jgi:hypothetical protein
MLFLCGRHGSSHSTLTILTLADSFHFGVPHVPGMPLDLPNKEDSDHNCVDGEDAIQPPAHSPSQFRLKPFAVRMLPVTEHRS